MAKLALVANPTFKAKVGVPVAGGDPVEVEFTFKHRTKTALEEWVNARAIRSDVESVTDMACGWELAEEFNPVNVGTLIENYAGAGLAMFKVYVDQLIQARLGNL